jgi:hypothetical protein
LTRRLERWAELGRKRFGELRRLAARPRVKRALRIFVIGTVALLSFYLLIGNALLRFGGLEWLVNQSTKDARLTLGPSYTWFPGRAEVRDLTLRFEDRNVQFELVVPRATAKLNLFALPSKRLHLRAVDADDVRFRFRHKVKSVAGNEKRLAHFPRIEGFSDPPLLKFEPPSDKSDDWAFLIENVRARGSELWFMEYRFQGRADVAGAFELVPGEKLWVGPARANFVSGDLGVGKLRPVLKPFRGSLDFRFRETNPDPIPGLAIFRQISATLELDADIVDLEAVNLYFSDASRVTVERGAARAKAHLALVDGRFAPDSFLTLRGSEDARLRVSETTLHGRLGFDLRTPAKGPGPPRLVVDSSLGSVTLWAGDPERARRADVRADQLRAMLGTDNADVASPWRLEEASFRVDGARVDDLGALDRAPSGKRVLEAGTAWFYAHAELTEGKKWSSALRADARRMRVRIGERRSLLDATLSAAAESQRRDLQSGALRDVRLELKDAAPSAERDPGLDVSVRAPHVAWSDFPPGVARGRATIRAPNLEPLLEALGAPPILLGVWPDAPFDASARVEVEPDTLDVDLDLAESGPFRAMGRLRVCSPARGAFLVKSGAFSVGLSVRDGKVAVVPLASSGWLAKNVPTCPGVE